MGQRIKYKLSWIGKLLSPFAGKHPALPATKTIKPTVSSGMLGAGVIHHKRKLITHTTLHPAQSALQTLVPWQKIFLTFVGLLIAGGLFLNTLGTAILVISLLSLIYFSDVLFNLYLIIKSLYFPSEISFSKNEMHRKWEDELPVYTILCPLYREAAVLSSFVESIKRLDWPARKLDVLLLLEEDDSETIRAIRRMRLPYYIKPLIVPHSLPKTKPKACNYGLNFAQGEYLVIFDAEDRPDSDQLKKVYLGFTKVPGNVVCLQAKLNYYNPGQNLLTRLFTAEYSLWFDVILPGLQSINTAIPLGGTSNHFKIDVLRKLQGWDPFNVTEDCDLGIRLFKAGLRTAIIDSTTLEEANSRPKNWVRQRSRWIKGYLQTFFVHNRHPLRMIREQGIHALLFQLIIGARISFMLINPLLWLMTIAYFTMYARFGPLIESLYLGPFFYMAVFALVAGNFMYLYNYMIGAARRREWSLMKYVYLIPFYWLMASAAAVVAVWQLLTRPHYWEKTIHGLHLQKATAKQFAQVVIPENVAQRRMMVSFEGDFFVQWKKIKSLISRREMVFGGALFVVANTASNVLNFAYNAYLGRALSIEDFATISLFGSFLFIASVPLAAMSATISRMSGYLLGGGQSGKAKSYALSFIRITVNYLLLITLVWLILTPRMSQYFHVESTLPFLLFSPVWIIEVVSMNISGYLRGTLAFGRVATVVVASSLIKLLTAWAFVALGMQSLVLASISLGVSAELFLNWLFIQKDKKTSYKPHEVRFEKGFFAACLLSGISSISFFAMDVVLANHFLTRFEAGEYGLLNLVGKVAFYGSAILAPFTIPLVSRNLGAGKDNKKTLTFLIGVTTSFAALSYIILGLGGEFFVPLLFGSKSHSIVQYLPVYVIAVGLFAVTRPIISYFQASKIYLFSIIDFLVALLQIALITIFHHDIKQFVMVMLLTSTINLILILLLYKYLLLIKQISFNFTDFKELLFPKNLENGAKALSYSKPLQILIFNWRDTKHVWAGGAESYVHELAKRWIKDGNRVTLFCGNDGHCPRNSKVDGVQIVRRGGFYTVYIWAFLYYVLRFRGNFDVVIDSENGIPFFTPLYVRKPKMLLIHHIHQEVFREHLAFPLCHIAIFLESRLMPLLYRNQKVITVSNSSREEILKMKLGKTAEVEVVNPGVELGLYKKIAKTKYPSLLYLGRLKPYKNIDVLIKAFKKIVENYPDAKLNIAGTGESLHQLQNMTAHLNLKRSVKFLGKVSEKQKPQLLGSSWVMVQPSMIEGWGITVIEANAAGTPVIASDVRGLRDSVLHNKTGLLVKPQHIEELIESVSLLFANKKMRLNLSKEAFIWSKNFSWEKSSETFFSIIKNNTFRGAEISYADAAVCENRLRVRKQEFKKI